MAGKKRGAHMYWRNGRAYGDFRAYEDVGGGREALSEPGRTWGTTDKSTADQLFANRLQELSETRQGRFSPKLRVTQLDKLVRDHLVKKRAANKVSHGHLATIEHCLDKALAFFGRKRDPSTIAPDDVQNWITHLFQQPNGRGGTLSSSTVHMYLVALSGLYGRAIEGMYVPHRYNPVAMLTDKPRPKPAGEAQFFEVAEAALILEAARIVDQRDRCWTATAGLYPLVATLLLTGGRKREVTGLQVGDIDFDRNVVRFRPNSHRGLKTITSQRKVPLWPQLRVILQDWIHAGPSPRRGLLFTSHVGGVVGDFRVSLDAIATLCGLKKRAIQAKAFRHTYCSARLQTVQRILKPGKKASEDDAWEYVEVSKFQVQKEMGHDGAQLIDRVYGHAQRTPYRSDVVEYRIERHREELGDRLKAVEATAAGP